MALEPKNETYMKFTYMKLTWINYSFPAQTYLSRKTHLYTLHYMAFTMTLSTIRILHVLILNGSAMRKKTKLCHALSYHLAKAHGIV